MGRRGYPDWTNKLTKGLALALALLPWPQVSAAEVICTIVADAETGKTVLEEGDCDLRKTPASTFKVPLAVIGFETGILESEDAPVLSYRAGDPDWGGEVWLRDTSPRDWMRHSVVWYSQRITRALGRQTLTDYAVLLKLGNADFSGDKGQDNGLDRAWLSSSLLISPREQVTFLCGLVQGTLPLSTEAISMTQAIMPNVLAGGWRFQGKTGGAFPREADGSFDYTRGIGWYVGWATRGDRTLVFARLTQANERQERSAGLITRDALLAQWPDLVARVSE